MGGNPLRGVAHAIDNTLVGAIADESHAKTLLFTVLIGAMVGVISRSGGTRAVVEGLARRAKSPRSVQVLSNSEQRIGRGARKGAGTLSFVRW